MLLTQRWFFKDTNVVMETRVLTMFRIFPMFIALCMTMKCLAPHITEIEYSFVQFTKSFIWRFCNWHKPRNKFWMSLGIYPIHIKYGFLRHFFITMLGIKHMYKFYKQEVEDLQPKHAAVTHIMSIGVITEMKKYLFRRLKFPDYSRFSR